MAAVPSDIEIAQAAKMQPIVEIAKKIGLEEDDLELYGKYIDVTAITPTPLGEGKTVTSIGLTEAMNKIGKSSIINIREPSMGPVFGIKGGAAGGGYSQVVPMEDLNLHFTGDIHAVGAANNLCAAYIDTSILLGNKLNIDPMTISWRRVVDISDRALREIVVGLGGKQNGYPRQTGFDITVASEVMAILALAENLDDLKARLARIVVAYTYDGKPVTTSDLKCAGSMAVLLKPFALATPSPGSIPPALHGAYPGGAVVDSELRQDQEPSSAARFWPRSLQHLARQWVVTGHSRVLRRSCIAATRNSAGMAGVWQRPASSANPIACPFSGEPGVRPPESENAAPTRPPDSRLP